jgi:hypothetical protein
MTALTVIITPIADLVSVSRLLDHVNLMANSMKKLYNAFVINRFRFRRTYISIFTFINHMYCINMYFTDVYCTDVYCTDMYCTEMYCIDLYCTDMYLAYCMIVDFVCIHKT